MNSTISTSDLIGYQYSFTQKLINGYPVIVRNKKFVIINSYHKYGYIIS